jgi:hypothetical protein
VTRGGESVNEARDLARDVREASTSRDTVPQTEEDALITVGSNALLAVD